MQSLSFMLSKRFSSSSASNPLFRISPNLVAHASSSSSPPTSPPSSAATAGNGSSSPSSTLHSLLRAPWSATQSRGISLSGSDVRVPNLVENQGRAYEVLKLYRPYEGTVPPHSTAGYATDATIRYGIERVERHSAMRADVGYRSKRISWIVKCYFVFPILCTMPSPYNIMILGILFTFWHTSAGVKEILADYVHHEMTRTFVVIAFNLFLIIAMKDIFLKFVLV